MNKVRIGIIEDEVIIADDIQALLEELGYECITPCGNYAEAIIMLNTNAPDLVIVDISLSGKPDGIAIARHIRDLIDIPFIFLTANSDPTTVASARETFPDAYLVKPFSKAALYSAIEVALYNYNCNKKNRKVSPEKKLVGNYLFIKENEYFHKVLVTDILYLSSEHVYVVVHTTKRKFLIRGSMQDYLATLDPTRFLRVHRSFAVNIDNIEKVNTSSLIAGGIEIPLSQNHRNDLLKALNILQ